MSVIVNDRLLGSVTKAVSALDELLLIECDATDDGDVQSVYDQVGEKWGSVDFVVHSVAYADRDDLAETFRLPVTKDSSPCSKPVPTPLMPVVSRAVPLITNGGAALTMTFDASQRVCLGYNIMKTAKAALEDEVRQVAAEFGDRNVRVNAISAGPLPTIAARSIPGFRDMTGAHRDRSPLKRNITHSEVGDTALFLLSEMASGITGAVIPADAGYGIIAL